MKTTVVNTQSPLPADELYLKKHVWASKYAPHLMKHDHTLESDKGTIITIFLIDDDVTFVKALEHALQGLLVNKEISVRSFSTGEECISHLDSSPTIIFLDYYLDTDYPNAINGLEVLKKIHKISPDSKVIMLSSQKDVKIVLKSLKLNIYGYIIKDQNTFSEVKDAVKKIAEEMDLNETKAKNTREGLALGVFLIIALVSLFFLSRWLF